MGHKVPGRFCDEGQGCPFFNVLEQLPAPGCESQQAQVTGLSLGGEVTGIFPGKIEEEMKEQPLEAGMGIAFGL